MRLTGRVRWFNDSKGVGLIHLDAGQDVPVHSSAIQGQEFKSLEPGQAVELEMIQGPRGPQAGRVTTPGRPFAQE